MPGLLGCQVPAGVQLEEILAKRGLMLMATVAQTPQNQQPDTGEHNNSLANDPLSIYCAASRWGHEVVISHFGEEGHPAECRDA